MKKALILGCGLMGRVMAQDLSRDGEFSITIVDPSAAALAAVASLPAVEARALALESASQITALASEAEVVLGALPSHLGMMAMEGVIEAGKPYCDIAFMIEDPRSLNAKAVERGAVVIYDCGVAPGITNILSNYELGRFDELERLQLYVGGLPKVRNLPYEYKAPFAPADVLEEYTRPARVVEGGEMVVKAALSEIERMHFEGVGSVEAFNTDGLRSLVELPVPQMSEKTIRYPGHAGLMQTLRESGFLSKHPLKLADGSEVAPLELTQALLFPQWKYQPGEADMTLFRVVASGKLNGVRGRVCHEMVDHYDAASDISSMGRTTAFPCAIVARWLAEGSFDRPGVHAPEVIGGEPELWHRLRDELAKRGVIFKEVHEFEADE